MKKTFLFLMMMASVIGVNAQSSSSESEKGDLDTLVISKVVRWCEDAGSGNLEQSYKSIENPYGKDASSGASDSLSSLIGSGGDQVVSDTLVMNRTDNNNVQSIASDTVCSPWVTTSPSPT